MPSSEGEITNKLIQWQRNSRLKIIDDDQDSSLYEQGFDFPHSSEIDNGEDEATDNNASDEEEIDDDEEPEESQSDGLEREDSDYSQENSSSDANDSELSGADGQTSGPVRATSRGRALFGADYIDPDLYGLRRSGRSSKPVEKSLYEVIG
jgi:hypothetical protein